VVKQMDHQSGPDWAEEAGAASAAADGLPPTVPDGADPAAAHREPGAEAAVGGQERSESAGDGQYSTSGPGRESAEGGTDAGGQAPSAGQLPSAGQVLSAGQVPSTGEPRVDAALRLLDRLPGMPVSEHSELFEQVHAQLSEVLGELDSGPAGG
jgi:hypothetical protein